MSIRLDHEKRRMVVAAAPGFSGQVVSQAIAQAIRADERVASYDFVMDVRQSDTGSSMDDFKIVLTAYNEVTRAAGLKFGCFVSHDPAYRFWASAMADLFGDRACPVFVTTETALAFLDAERQGVTA